MKERKVKREESKFKVFEPPFVNCHCECYWKPADIGAIVLVNSIPGSWCCVRHEYEIWVIYVMLMLKNMCTINK